jgi:hypothetical protein
VCSAFSANVMTSHCFAWLLKIGSEKLRYKLQILLFILKKSARFVRIDLRGAHEKLYPIVCFNDYRIMWQYRFCELQSSRLV